MNATEPTRLADLLPDALGHLTPGRAWSPAKNVERTPEEASHSILVEFAAEMEEAKLFYALADPEDPTRAVAPDILWARIRMQATRMNIALSYVTVRLHAEGLR